jgi:serine/threonine protein kinase/tetratricopeptide (TPR) repeat protein
MSANRDREEEIFDAARELPAHERAAYIAERCGQDADLRQRIEGMLAADAAAGEFFKTHDAPSSTAIFSDANLSSSMEKAGDRIGRYKLLQQIGEGGCGVVYMAEQEEPVRRRVALKVIKLGMDTKQVIARFEAERQALALMDHPNIARVLDAGATATGRPYFVMELVRGTKITEFCDQKELPTQERLDLFLQACSAIQHAHQKGIIHRDIKPSNILVTVVDGVPVPKVIDFGIAKATNNQQLTDKTVFTAFEQFIGTPAYMSPEQAELSGVDIDTRTDIYSLGVVLYELLTGSPPFDQKELLAAGLDEMRRIIRETEPPRPSNRLSTMAAAALTSTAHHRHTEPPRLVHQVRGDLDWIVMKALEKDRGRRYETANGFALDVQRYLANEPVTASPPSTVYRLRKFVKRHKGGVAVAGLVMFFLVLAGSGIGWAIRERSARHSRVSGKVALVLAEVDQLLREQKWAEALLAARRAGAVVEGGEADAATEQRVRELLKDLEFVGRLEQIRMKRSAWIDGEFDLAGPNLEYEQSFRDYGVDAVTLPVETAIERLKARQPFAVPLAAALDGWAGARSRLKNDAASAKRLVAVARGIDPEPLRDKVRSTWGKPASEVGDELQRLAETIDIRAQHPATILMLEGKLTQVKRLDAALHLSRSAQNAFPSDFFLNYDLAQQLAEKKDYEGAVRFYTAAVAIRPHAVAARNNLGIALSNQERLDEAIACYRKAIDIDPNFAVAYCNLGVALGKQGKVDEQEAAYRKAIDLDPKYAPAYRNLGYLLALQNKLDDAVSAYRKSIELDPKKPVTYLDLGFALFNLGKRKEAIAAYRKSIGLDPGYALAYGYLADALKADKKLNEAVAAYRKAIELKPEWAGYHNNLGALLCDFLRDYAGAAACFRRAIELDPKCTSAHSNLGYALYYQRKEREALAASSKAVAMDPQSAPAHRAIAFVLATASDAGLRNPGQALAHARKAVELDPMNPDFRWVLGVACYRTGDWKAAIAAFEKARELYQSDDRTDWFFLAMAHWQLGDKAEARKWYDKSVKVVGPIFSVTPEVLSRIYKEAAELLGVNNDTPR